MTGVFMNTIRTALLAATTLAFATPSLAQVVTVTDTTTGTPLSTKIDESSTNTDNDKIQVYGSTAAAGASADVTFTGGNTLLTNEAAATTLGSSVAGDLDITPGGGFAFVSDGPADGTNNLYAIIINPDSLFTDMKFALQLTGEGTFDIYYLLDGGASFVNAGTTFTTDNKGNTNYLVDVTGGYFDAIQIFSSGASIFELKQISLNLAAVPEPASWATMLLGFAGIDVVMRRRRRRNPALMQIA